MNHVDVPCFAMEALHCKVMTVFLGSTDDLMEMLQQWSNGGEHRVLLGSVAENCAERAQRSTGTPLMMDIKDRSRGMCLVSARRLEECKNVGSLLQIESKY